MTKCRSRINLLISGSSRAPTVPSLTCSGRSTPFRQASSVTPALSDNRLLEGKQATVFQYPVLSKPKEKPDRYAAAICIMVRPKADQTRPLHAWIKVAADINLPAVDSNRDHRKAWKKNSKHSDALIIPAPAKKGDPAAENHRTRQKRGITCDMQWQVRASDRKDNRRSEQSGKPVLCTFGICPPILRMSADRGRPELDGAGQNDAIDLKETFFALKVMRHERGVLSNQGRQESANDQRPHAASRRRSTRGKRPLVWNASKAWLGVHDGHQRNSQPCVHEISMMVAVLLDAQENMQAPETNPSVFQLSRAAGEMISFAAFDINKRVATLPEGLDRTAATIVRLEAAA
jgi:hypothetical protein